jgi:hypothetical protein
MQPLRSAGEVQLLGNGQKVPKVTKFHESMSL